MIYLNNNKIIINNPDAFRKAKPSDKQNIIKILRNNLDISDYSIFFINNTYEAYTLLLHSIIVSYSKIGKPHIITNKMEDPHLLAILENFKTNGKISIGYVKSNIYGTINVNEIEYSIQKNKPCLIINSFLNYFTGSVNNVEKIGEVAHKYKIPLYCDCTYAFGKLPIQMNKQNIDIATFDLNLPGFSFIVIKNNLIKGYKLDYYSIKFKNDIENVNLVDPRAYGIAKAILCDLYKNRKAKNKALVKLKNNFLKKNKYMYYSDFIAVNSKDIQNNNPIDLPDLIIFGKDINESSSAPHIISILKTSKSIKKNNVLFCKIPKGVFKNIGIIDKWENKIITIGLSDSTKLCDISEILKSL